MNAARLVVVPSDPIEAYEIVGYDALERYYNPAGIFDEVFVLSPRETRDRQAHGMTLIKVESAHFRNMLQHLQPQVVRAYGGFWAADLTCSQRLPQVPVVVSLHDKRPQMIHDSVRYADLVICLSRAVEEAAVARGIDRRRIRLLPNRIDRSIFRPRLDSAARQQLDRRFPAKKRILHVGRKAPEKNLDTLIKTLPKLPGYACVFVGHGDRRPYERLAVAEGVAERCFWVDSVKNSQLPVWYSWCDCFCVASRFEGFGIVFIEAAACGAAIVTSSFPPMTEYLADDDSACLVKDYEDPDALACAIRRVCEDEAYRQRLTAGAVEAARPFDREIVDRREGDIYREAMAMPPLAWRRRLEIAAWYQSTRLRRRVRRDFAKIEARLRPREH